MTSPPRTSTGLVTHPSAGAAGAAGARPPLAGSSIDFVSDVICPWCFIGLQRVEQMVAALALGGEDAQPTIVFHPFQLDPSTPPEGADLRERLRKKYGVDPELAFARVEAAARESGIPLDFAKVHRTPNTLKAHALIAAAKPTGNQHAVVRSLFEAYFLEGADVSDDAVLLAIAAKHGLAKDVAEAALVDPAALEAVREETQALASQGIRGVPFVIFDGKVAVSGAQPVAVFRQAYDQAREA